MCGEMEIAHVKVFSSGNVEVVRQARVDGLAGERERERERAEEEFVELVVEGIPGKVLSVGAHGLVLHRVDRREEQVVAWVGGRSGVLSVEYCLEGAGMWAPEMEVRLGEGEGEGEGKDMADVMLKGRVWQETGEDWGEFVPLSLILDGRPFRAYNDVGTLAGRSAPIIPSGIRGGGVSLPLDAESIGCPVLSRVCVVTWCPLASRFRVARVATVANGSDAHLPGGTCHLFVGNGFVSQDLSGNVSSPIPPIPPGASWDVDLGGGWGDDGSCGVVVSVAGLRPIVYRSGCGFVIDDKDEDAGMDVGDVGDVGDAGDASALSSSTTFLSMMLSAPLSLFSSSSTAQSPPETLTVSSKGGGGGERVDESMLVIRVAAVMGSDMGSEERSQPVCVEVGGVRKWIGGEGGEEVVEFPCPSEWMCFSLLHQCCAASALRRSDPSNLSEV